MYFCSLSVSSRDFRIRSLAFSIESIFGESTNRTARGVLVDLFEADAAEEEPFVLTIMSGNTTIPLTSTSTKDFFLEVFALEYAERKRLIAITYSM